MWRRRVCATILLVICTLALGFPDRSVVAQSSADQRILTTLQRALEGRLPLLGPESGSAEGPADTVQVIPFDVSVLDFAVQFDCYLAPPADADIPDCSLLVRRTSDDSAFVVSVASDGSWFAGTAGENPIHEGALRNHIVGGDLAARMSLFAIGDLGYFSVNNALVDVLDLSSHMAAGSVAAGTGFSPGAASSTRVLSVSQLRIWSFDGFSQSQLLSTISTDRSEGIVSSFDVLSSHEPVSGPLAGALEHSADRASFLRADVDLADLAVRLVCNRPDRAEDQLWDCGVVFRLGESADDQFRFIALSSGQWILAKGTDQVIQTGEFALDGGETLTAIKIEMIAEGDSGWVRINDGVDSPLELGTRVAPGDVAAGTAFFPETNIDGDITSYEAFSVWQIGGQDLQATPVRAVSEWDSDFRDMYRDHVLLSLLRESLQNVSPAFGPESGTMRHDPSSITFVSVTESIEAPAVAVECGSFDDGLQQLRDCGIVVRSTNDGTELRYVLVSDGFWSVTTSAGVILDQGTVSNSADALVGGYRLIVVPLDGDLLFGFNGEFLSRIPNPVSGVANEVLIGTAFYSETYQDGGEVSYDELIVWSMADYLAPLAIAAAANDAAPEEATTGNGGSGQFAVTQPAIAADPSLDAAATSTITAEQAASIAVAVIRPLDESGMTGYAVLTRVARSVEVSVLIASQARDFIAFVLPGSCNSVDVREAAVGRVGPFDNQRLAAATLDIRLTQLLSQETHAVVIFAANDVTLATPLACGEIEAAP